MKKFLVAFFIFSLAAQDSQKEFIKSFVSHYDSSPEGRYTHEYHPFLLQQTRTSLEQLERHLSAQGFNLQDRVLVMGYQQEGVPSYYSNMHAKPITDEVSLKTKKGRVVPAHNIFGFLTGFLLKDCNWLQQQWFGYREPLVEHVNADRITLFDDNAYLFQKHAFGKDFEHILKARNLVEATFKKQNIATTLNMLTVFWDKLYKGELKSSGQEVLATQDILFSVDYAKHLAETTRVPLKKMYIGPDITYPIEVLPFQEQEVTASAQSFVQKFAATLQPRNNKKTAYVFCSFVDGVGKSTLLGNVVNFSKHGTAIENYERVDNSSSQRGTLYQLNSDVFILDLPAQLSHWVSKPDGQVFVDVAIVKEYAHMQKDLYDHLSSNAQKYKKVFEQKLQETYTAPTSLYDRYVYNVQLIEGASSWVPFEYNNQLFIFDKHNHNALKCLVPLEGVHSRGLKTCQPEQMLFTNGLLLPMHYDAFMNDISAQCKQAGIENLVFVDFLSMYPRSSRENVRINFLMQQLRILFPEKFSVATSLYKSLINRGPELFQLLAESKDRVTDALYSETVVRTALYTLFKNKSTNDVVSLSDHSVTQHFAEQIAFIESEHGEYIKNITRLKIEHEFEAVKKYAQDKNYETFVKFSFSPLLAYSEFVNNLFEYQVDNIIIRDLWNNVEQQMSMKQLYSFEHSCRDSVALTPFFKSLRAQWYATLSNLLTVDAEYAGVFGLRMPSYAILPVTLVEKDNKVVCLQKEGSFAEEGPLFLPRSLSTFHNYISVKNAEWVNIHNVLYCSEWQRSETYWGVYAFGCDYFSQGLLKKHLVSYTKEKHAEGFDNVALTSSEARQVINSCDAWDSVCKKQYGASVPQIVKYGSGQWKAVQLWVRAIATLEMILKDPDAWIITRKGNKQDFAATLELLERVTLPKYFNLKTDRPLFKDYSLVDPVIDWNQIQ